MAKRKSKPKGKPAAASRLPSVVSPAKRKTPLSPRIPIIGIGASAGGVGALLEFFQTVPDHTGMSFIVVQHLDPTRTSEMPGLLGRRTPLPVLPAEDGMAVEPDRVYTIPPDRYVLFEEGCLKVITPPEPRGQRLPVDALFYSLAEHAADCAVGVILSGNGADGSLGLRAIKGHGGLAVVQDPTTAEFDGMPRNAIATGVVDHILSLAEMMDTIRGFVDHDYVQKPVQPEGAPVPSHVTGILSLLHARRNVDFTGYKKGTLLRRIERRMSVRHVTRGSDYLRMLQENPDEVNALFNDLLIQVTRFFREPEAWKFLKTEVVTRLVAEADKNTPIRVWVPGCASGEEAFSIAMLLLEQVERAQKHVAIQIFASDLDQVSLEQARQGSYPHSIAADVSPERLRRFFVKSEHRYTVNQLLRDTCVFAHHNMLVDPPFSRLDLVSCRNVLIYFESVLQRRVFDLFHFALKPGRFLFLGTSETVGAQTDLFQPMDKKVKIFRRLGTLRGERLRLSLTSGLHHVNAPLPGFISQSQESFALQKARDLILERHTRATALVNRRNEIIALFGPTSDYLDQPSGPLTSELLNWVKEGLRPKVRSAIQTAIRRQDKVVLKGVRTQRNGKPVVVSVTVEPLTAQPESDGLLLVVFEDEVTRVRGATSSPQGKSSEPLIRQLEYELKVARDDLQSSVEQMESSTEELRAANEEALSINEELQSTNEELETSKEELQSVNEELITVNSQLEQRFIEQQVLNDDISNLLASTDMPVLFLDRNLAIRRFTAAITRLFSLIPADVGRPIEDITRKVDDPGLLDDARQVLDRLTPIERTVMVRSDQGYIRQVLPYRTMTDRIEGVVVVYTNVSDRIAADARVREARDFAEAVISSLREPLLVLDDHLVAKSANEAFYRVFNLTPERVVGRRVFEIGGHEWNVPEFRALLDQLTKGNSPIVNYEIQREFAGIGPRAICVNAKLLRQPDGAVVLLAFEDVTLRLEAEQARNEAIRELMTYDEKERHRLALELHDETGQHLTAFLLGLASLRDSNTDRPEVRKVVQDLQARAEELARNLHGISLQLRPRALDDHGLERAMVNYAEDIRVRHGLDVEFQTMGRDLGRLPGPMEIVLYRVTQEALTNVVKHAKASKVSIVTSRKQKEVQLIIEDDGQGFEPAELEVNGKHLGLRGMRERVMLAGGTLAIESTRGKGTTLFARLPIRESSHGDDE